MVWATLMPPYAEEGRRLEVGVFPLEKMLIPEHFSVIFDCMGTLIGE